MVYYMFTILVCCITFADERTVAIDAISVPRDEIKNTSEGCCVKGALCHAVHHMLCEQQCTVKRIKKQ